MKLHFSLLMLLTTGLVASAERIDGPANIRDTPKGETIFSLNDNVEIETSEATDGWYEILITIDLTKEQYDEKPVILKKGTKLYAGGKEIGVALRDIRVSSLMTAGGAPGIPKWYAGELHGYTFKSNIRPESVIEPVVSRLIESNKTNLTREAFEKHLTDFKYTEGLPIAQMAHLTTYMIYESSIDDPSPLDRVRLIFDGERLIAIVHSRNLSVTGFETVPIARERKLTMLATFNDNQKRNFIEKNNESYRGVD